MGPAAMSYTRKNGELHANNLGNEDGVAPDAKLSDKKRGGIINCEKIDGGVLIAPFVGLKVGMFRLGGGGGPGLRSVGREKNVGKVSELPKKGGGGAKEYNPATSRESQKG